MRDRQRAESRRALGVDSALRNALAILVSELFQQLIILHQERSARTGGDGVLVVGDRIAARCSHDFDFFSHQFAFSLAH